MAIKDDYLKQRSWHQWLHERWHIGHSKQQQEDGSAKQQVRREQEAQPYQDDRAGLDGVVCDDCTPFAPSECHL